MSEATTVMFCHPGTELYGSDRMAVASVAALVAGGYRVIVVVPNTGPLIELFEQAGAEVFVVTLPVLRKSLLKPAAFARLGLSMPGILRKARRLIRSARADLVYVNTVTQPWWIEAARQVRRPTVVHVREAETGVPGIVQRGLAFPLAFATQIVANSASTRDHVVDKGIGLAAKTRIIYNGKDWSAYHRSAFAGISSQPNILLVGRISPRKGTDTAVKALGTLVERGVDARLVIAGDVFPGYEWFADEVRQLATSLGVADRCEFTGFVSDTADLLENADVVIAPSRVEPFGTVAAEGMAAERPTIVSDVQGLVEIVDSEAVGSVFPAESAEALADAIAALVSDPLRAQRMAAAGRRSVIERFSVQQYEEATLAVVADALGRRASTRPVDAPAALQQKAAA
ncbi:glycosyltransferase family 4 protein [Rathayibacter sp. YIM 133350]|uniref:glycosyltransferase family 4 protein n=1 Tax=Rathayibacter sp. YIM 133350 TaxID=3131992 RepID=UPI00307CF1AE